MHLTNVGTLTQTQNWFRFCIWATQTEQAALDHANKMVADYLDKWSYYKQYAHILLSTNKANIDAQYMYKQFY